MNNISKALVILSVAAMPTAGWAQDFPSRNISLIIPWSAGGSNDVIGRYMAEKLSEMWGQAVVVENRPGAGGNIGAAHVVQSAPDGYTILFTSGALTTAPAIVSELLFDPLTDLVPSGVAAFGDRIAVSSLEFNSLSEIYDKAQSETVFYGTSGLGGSAHFDTLRLSDAMGAQMEPVHYQGGTDALVDLAGGRLDFYLGSVTQVLPSVTGGSVRPVAVLSESRSPALPDVPTIAEAGFPGAESYIWWASFVPADTPPEVVSEISSSISAVMSTPEAVEFLETQGGRPAETSVEEFSDMIAVEVETFKSLAEQYGLTPS